MMQSSLAASLRNKLALHGYHEKALQSLEIDPFSITPEVFPIIEGKIQGRKPLNILVSLFLLGQAVDTKKAGTVFASKEIDSLVRLKVLAVSQKNKISSNMKISPYSNFYFASDFTIRDSSESHSDHRGGKFLVYPPGQDSVTLAEATVRDRVASTLDLCTGCGMHAILASRHSKRVVGTDINSKAIDFANFNLLLNCVKNVEFKLGNLYAPVQSEKFDLILANPPFVISPDDSALYRDGGRRGDRSLKEILRGMPHHLRKGGYCQIVTLLSEFSGTSQEESVRRALRKNSYNTLLLAFSAFDLYQLAYGQYRAHVWNFKEYRTKMLKYIEYLRKIKLEKTSLCLITIKHGLKYQFKRWNLITTVELPIKPIDKIKGYYDESTVR